MLLLHGVHHLGNVLGHCRVIAITPVQHEVFPGCLRDEVIGAPDGRGPHVVGDQHRVNAEAVERWYNILVEPIFPRVGAPQPPHHVRRVHTIMEQGSHRCSYMRRRDSRLALPRRILIREPREIVLVEARDHLGQMGYDRVDLRQSSEADEVKVATRQDVEGASFKTRLLAERMPAVRSAHATPPKIRSRGECPAPIRRRRGTPSPEQRLQGQINISRCGQGLLTFQGVHPSRVDIPELLVVGHQVRVLGARPLVASSPAPVE